MRVEDDAVARARPRVGRRQAVHLIDEDDVASLERREEAHQRRGVGERGAGDEVNPPAESPRRPFGQARLAQPGRTRQEDRARHLARRRRRGLRRAGRLSRHRGGR